MRSLLYFSSSSMCVSHSIMFAFCDPMDYSPPGSFVHGILQARTLEWIAIPFSRGSSWPRDQTQSPLQADSLLSEPPGKPTGQNEPDQTQMHDTPPGLKTLSGSQVTLSNEISIEDGVGGSRSPPLLSAAVGLPMGLCSCLLSLEVFLQAYSSCPSHLCLNLSSRCHPEPIC